MYVGQDLEEEIWMAIVDCACCRRRHCGIKETRVEKRTTPPGSIYSKESKKQQSLPKLPWHSKMQAEEVVRVEEEEDGRRRRRWWWWCWCLEVGEGGSQWNGDLEGAGGP
jgi:hypothetical protein